MGAEQFGQEMARSQLGLAREKFEYDKEQDRLNRQLQDAEATGQYPKGYLSDVAKLNQSLSTNIDLAEDQKREAFDLGVLRLNRLYRIVPTGLSPRLGIGGGQGLETQGQQTIEPMPLDWKGTQQQWEEWVRAGKPR